MARPWALVFLLLAALTLLSACQGFFEDYSYQPLGASTSSSGY